MLVIRKLHKRQPVVRISDRKERKNKSTLVEMRVVTYVRDIVVALALEEEEHAVIVADMISVSTEEAHDLSLREAQLVMCNSERSEDVEKGAGMAHLVDKPLGQLGLLDTTRNGFINVQEHVFCRFICECFSTVTRRDLEVQIIHDPHERWALFHFSSDAATTAM